MLLCIFDAKKGCKKKSLNKFSLAADLLKTAFLVSMATARKVSEVHALSMADENLRFSRIDGSLILRTQLGI